MTPKQQRFVEEYSLDSNATQAAIRAGYSAASAKVTASRMLTNANVQQAIEERRNEISERVDLTEEKVLRGLLKEAEREDDSATHSARVSAWSWLGKYKRMFEDDDRGRNAPPPVTVNIIAAQISKH